MSPSVLVPWILSVVGQSVSLPVWDMTLLSPPPATRPAEGFQTPGMQGLFYQGLPYQGKSTEVFAWLSVPESRKKVPGMVLVHGGGGTAFEEWVALWRDRGYAAIAMDTCGCTPKGEYGNWSRHAQPGPPGWGGFDQIDQPIEDQWAYHAIADVVLAHSLLRSQPGVDPDRIGLTGVSWGGYLTCMVAGVDPRFKFVVPVYGCGDIPETTFGPGVKALGEDRASRWLSLWEPASYLKQATMPMLWVTGSNDFAYPLNALQASYRRPKGPRQLCIRLRMPHGHGGPSEKPEEIHVFANSLLKKGDPLVRITEQGRDGNQVWAKFSGKTPMKSAELEYTLDSGPWPDRQWQTLPAALERHKVTATLPEKVQVYYLNLVDSRDLVVSTEHVDLGQESSP